MSKPNIAVSIQLQIKCDEKMMNIHFITMYVLNKYCIKIYSLQRNCESSSKSFYPHPVYFTIGHIVHCIHLNF